MKELLRKLSMGYASGAVASVFYSVLFGLLMYYGGFSYCGGHFPLLMTHDEALRFFNHELIWGGAFGLLFGLPIIESASWWKRGFLLGLIPALVLLLYVYPFADNAGFAAQSYGTWAFAAVLILNWFWGLVAASWYQGFGK